MKKNTLIILLITSPLVSMEMPTPSRGDLRYYDLLGAHCAKTLNEITPKIAEGLAELEQCDVGPKHRKSLAESLIKHAHLASLCTTHLRTVPRNGRFSPDGSKLLIHHNNALHIYDAQSGKQLNTLQSPINSKGLWGNKAKWSPCGNYISALNTDTIYGKNIWDSKTGKHLYNLNCNASAKIKCTADDKNWIIKEHKKPWVICDTKSGKLRKVLGTASDQAVIPVQDPTGKWIITNEFTQNLKSIFSIFYDAQTLQEEKCLPGSVSCFSSDGSLIVLESNPTLHLYNRSFAYLRTLEPQYLFFHTAFNSDKTKLVCYEMDGETVFNLKDGAPAGTYIHKILTDKKNSFTSKDLSTIIILDYDEKKDSTDIVIEAELGKKSLTVSGDMRNLYYTYDNEHYMLGKKDAIKHILNIKTGTTIPINNSLPFKKFKRTISKLVSSDGKFLTKSDDPNDKSIQVRQIITPEKIPLITLFTAIAEKNKEK